MRVLVTGGAGYIGSHICEELAKSGDYAVAYDNGSVDGFGNITPRGDLDMVEGDILNTAALTAVLQDKGIDAVIHCAAASVVSDSFLRPEAYVETNISGTLSVLRAMSAAGVRHIVATSSAAVYGNAVRDPIPESSQVFPINPYGITKVAMEQLLYAMRNTLGITSVALRCFNVAGAADHYIGRLNDTHIIPRIVQQGMELVPPIKIYGREHPTPDGTCIRDYTHVVDVAHGHLQALRWMTQPPTQPQTPYFFAYNLCTGQGTSINEIIQAHYDCFGGGISTVDAKARPGDPHKLVGGTSLFSYLTKWKPCYSSLNAMLVSTRNSYSAARAERRRNHVTTD